MKFILYPQSNNKLAVIVPITDVDNAIKDVPKGVEYKIVESLNINGLFFDAYEFDQEIGAKINISKAKEIWLEHYRRTRTPLLEKLDLEYIRADEQGNLELKKQIASKKQALRDITKTNLPNTLEGIKSSWPEILGKNPFV